MRKKINYIVEYREKGEDKEVEISIDFISNRVMKNYSALVILAEEVQYSHNRISDIISTIAGEDLTDEKKEKLIEEKESCTSKIMEFNTNGYFERRFKILETILIDNGYEDNDKLINLDFWDNCVEPAELLKFMTSAVYKDVDQKKKLRAV